MNKSLSGNTSNSGKPSHQGSNPDDEFVLARFFPYLVRVFYRSVSEVVSTSYEEEYGLSVSEWRTMAVLGPYGAMSASEIVALSSMDKVTVSRAIKGLQMHGYLKRDIDGDDKRRVVLHLTKTGREAFIAIVPKVKEASDRCLTGLSQSEITVLVSLMERVRENAKPIVQINKIAAKNNLDV